MNAAMTLYGIPTILCWIVGIAAVAVGLLSVLTPDRVVGSMKALALWQLRQVRSARYRQWLKINGWLLLVMGLAVLALLSLLDQSQTTNL